jgi:hypothetical protein
MADILYPLTLLANSLWFGSAFWYFALKRTTAAKLLIPRSARSSPIFSTMEAALPFLGGMNLALSLLALMLLVQRGLFVAPAEQATLLVAFAVAHATQFAINVPVALRGGRIGESYWEVTSGPMLFIFVVDALMTLLNIGCAAYLLA